MSVRGFLCARCQLFLRLAAEDTSMIEHLLSTRAPCPECREDPLRPTVLSHHPGYRVLSLTPQELWQAVTGLGLPDERVQPEAIQEMLLEEKVVGLESWVSPSGRCMIERMTLTNGKTLHFAASGSGATIYRVTE